MPCLASPLILATWRPCSPIRSSARVERTMRGRLSKSALKICVERFVKSSEKLSIRSCKVGAE